MGRAALIGLAIAASAPPLLIGGCAEAGVASRDAKPPEATSKLPAEDVKFHLVPPDEEKRTGLYAIGPWDTTIAPTPAVLFSAAADGKMAPPHEGGSVFLVGKLAHQANKYGTRRPFCPLPGRVAAGRIALPVRRVICPYTTPFEPQDVYVVVQLSPLPAGKYSARMHFELWWEKMDAQRNTVLEKEPNPHPKVVPPELSCDFEVLPAGSAAAGGTRGSARRASQPLSKAAWERRLSGIHEGLSRPSVHRILAGLGAGQSGQWFPENEKHELYYLTQSGGWRVHVTYSPMWAVESLEVFQPSFSDLRNVVGDGLFPYVKLVHESPSLTGVEFNPVDLIRAVNGLRPTGKKKVLEVMSAYHRLARDMTLEHKYDLDEQRIFLILRLLFVRKDGESMMPQVVVGAPDIWPRDSDRKSWPLFPLALVDDVPLFLVGGYMLAGVAQSPVEHIEYCRKHCRLRDKLLAPTACPVAAAEKLLASARWKRLTRHGEGRLTARGKKWLEDRIRGEAHRALGPIHDFRGWSCNETPRWEENARAVRALRPQWDAKKQIFVASHPPE